MGRQLEQLHQEVEARFEALCWHLAYHEAMQNYETHWDQHEKEGVSRTKIGAAIALVLAAGAGLWFGYGMSQVLVTLINVMVPGYESLIGEINGALTGTNSWTKKEVPDSVQHYLRLNGAITGAHAGAMLILAPAFALYVWSRRNQRHERAVETKECAELLMLNALNEMFIKRPLTAKYLVEAMLGRSDFQYGEIFPGAQLGSVGNTVLATKILMHLALGRRFKKIDLKSFESSPGWLARILDNVRHKRSEDITITATPQVKQEILDLLQLDTAQIATLIIEEIRSNAARERAENIGAWLYLILAYKSGDDIFDDRDAAQEFYQKVSFKDLSNDQITEVLKQIRDDKIRGAFLTYLRSFFVAKEDERFANQYEQFVRCASTLYSGATTKLAICTALAQSLHDVVKEDEQGFINFARNLGLSPSLLVLTKYLTQQLDNLPTAVENIRAGLERLFTPEKTHCSCLRKPTPDVTSVMKAKLLLVRLLYSEIQKSVLSPSQKAQCFAQCIDKLNCREPELIQQLLGLVKREHLEAPYDRNDDVIVYLFPSNLSRDVAIQRFKDLMSVLARVNNPNIIPAPKPGGICSTLGSAVDYVCHCRYFSGYRRVFGRDGEANNVPSRLDPHNLDLGRRICAAYREYLTQSRIETSASSIDTILNEHQGLGFNSTEIKVLKEVASDVPEVRAAEHVVSSDVPRIDSDGAVVQRRVDSWDIGEGAAAAV